MSQLMFGPTLDAELAYHRELLDAAYHRPSLWRRLHDRTPAAHVSPPRTHRRRHLPLVHRHA